jgi:hypothetical protein
MARRPVPPVVGRPTLSPDKAFEKLQEQLSCAEAFTTADEGTFQTWVEEMPSRGQNECRPETTAYLRGGSTSTGRRRTG